MRKLIQKGLKNQKGLTLIELLVVIVILGIIAAITITIPMVMGNAGKANDAVAAQINSVVKDAVNRHNALESDSATE